jgi:DNA-binding transcriptional LysR family regulator
LPPLIRELRDAHPGCDIRLFEEETDEPDLTELDLMLFDGRVGGDIEHLKLLDDPHVLVTRPDDFPPGAVRLEQLDGLHLVTHPAICDQAKIEEILKLEPEEEDRSVRVRSIRRAAQLEWSRTTIGVLGR